MIRKFYGVAGSEYGSSYLPEQKTAVNGTFLAGLHTAFIEQGERLEKNIQRLVILGNKLSDDSGSIKEEDRSAEKRVESINPGSLRELQNDVDGFRKLNAAIENQLSKLEKLI